MAKPMGLFGSERKPGPVLTGEPVPPSPPGAAPQMLRPRLPSLSQLCLKRLKSSFTFWKTSLCLFWLWSVQRTSQESQAPLSAPCAHPHREDRAWASRLKLLVSRSVGQSVSRW